MDKQTKEMAKGRKRHVERKGTNTFKTITATYFKYDRHQLIIQNIFGRNKWLIDLSHSLSAEWRRGQPFESSHWLAVLGAPSIEWQDSVNGTSHAPPPISIQHHPRDTWKRRKTQRKREKHKNRRDSH